MKQDKTRQAWRKVTKDLDHQVDVSSSEIDSDEEPEDSDCDDYEPEDEDSDCEDNDLTSDDGGCDEDDNDSTDSDDGDDYDDLNVEMTTNLITRNLA
ncbi:hypothetical protein Tco_0398695 [Tanacetum coccineum]